VDPDNYSDLLYKYPLIVILDDSQEASSKKMGWDDTLRLASCSFPKWLMVCEYLMDIGLYCELCSSGTYFLIDVAS
jgi:hypothetical protein